MTDIGGYAASENLSASLSQSATRFHLGQIWATKPVQVPESQVGRC